MLGFAIRRYGQRFRHAITVRLSARLTALLSLHRPSPMFGRCAHSLSRSFSGLADIWYALLPYRIMLPFCLGYMLSYFSRNISAILADDFSMEFAITANSLGLLTSAYFLAFALCQLPLGVLLDRFTAARVEACFLTFAALGAFLSATAESASMLSLGRILMGFGVSACLMAAYRGILQWFPAPKVPLLNGFILASGGLGAVISGWPPTAQFAIDFGWRNIFWILTYAFVIATVVLWLVVPKNPKPVESAHVDGDDANSDHVHDDDAADGAPVKDKTSGDAVGGLVMILRSSIFWRIMPMAAATQGLMLAINGLWIAPWLMRTEGYNLQQASMIMMLISAAMVMGQLLAGWLGSFVGGGKQALARLMLAGCIVANLAILLISVRAGLPSLALWLTFTLAAPFAMLAYPLLTQQFSLPLAGRVITLLNFWVFLLAFFFQWMIGAIIGTIDPNALNVDLLRFQMGFAAPAFLAIFSIIWTLAMQAISYDKEQ